MKRPRDGRLIATPAGTTVYLTDSDDGVEVVLANPHVIERIRSITAGTVTERGGFQPVKFLMFSMGPDVLRAIADLIEPFYKEPRAERSPS